MQAFSPFQNGPVTVELGFDTTSAHIGWFLARLGGRVTCADPNLSAHVEEARRALDSSERDPERLMALGALALLAGKALIEEDEGAEEVRSRLAEAHIIIAPSNQGGAREAARCAALREQYPSALVISITPFGLSGERSEWVANDFLSYHAGGDAYFLPPGPGAASRAPVVAGDYAPGRMAGWSVLAPVLAFARDVRRTGQGMLLEISRQEALLDLSRVEISRAANNGAVESRLTKAYETGGIMFAADRPVVLMPLEDHQWAKLWTILGEPDWSQTADYATRDGRKQHAPEVQARLQSWVADHTSDEIYALAQAAGVPVGVVRRPTDVIRAPQTAAREFVERRTVRDITVSVPGLPFVVTSRERPEPAAAPIAASSTSTTARGPLAGVRILDFGTAWAGPHATETLALLGADVVKVESRRRLDLFRAMTGVETTPGFNDINLSKRSICLDLSTGEGKQIAQRLARVADVAVDNFRPGVMTRLGLDYDALSQINPAIICASVSAFGATGPAARHSGYAAIFCAMGGLAHLTGYQDWEPALVRSPMDLSVANATAATIVAALADRDRSGRGGFVDISATDVVTTLIPGGVAAAGAAGWDLDRHGNESWRGEFQQVYRAAGEDEWVAVAAWTGAQLNALSRFAAELDPGGKPDEALGPWSATMPAAQAAAILQERGIPAVPTISPVAVVGDTHLRGRGLFAQVDHPVQGPLLAVGRVWRGPDSAPEPERAPLLGEHTAAVLTEWLAMDAAEIDALEATGALS